MITDSQAKDGIMTKRVILLTISTLCASSIVYFYWFSQSALEDVYYLVSKELPQGSSKQQVYDFLESRAIPSGAYNAGPDPYGGLTEEDRKWKRSLVASISKLSHVPFFPDSTIKIYFYFDENQNLDEFKLQEFDDVP